MFWGASGLTCGMHNGVREDKTAPPDGWELAPLAQDHFFCTQSIAVNVELEPHFLTLCQGFGLALDVLLVHINLAASHAFRLVLEVMLRLHPTVVSFPLDDLAGDFLLKNSLSLVAPGPPVVHHLPHRLHIPLSFSFALAFVFSLAFHHVHFLALGLSFAFALRLREFGPGLALLTLAFGGRRRPIFLLVICLALALRLAEANTLIAIPIQEHSLSLAAFSSLAIPFASFSQLALPFAGWWPVIIA
mmetsp:Transcript_55082/g.128523  ORF Transcript_55082/g.128523 Transcript_55082/m.128523 type:complete len:246 (-) Transcript_55082:215-952(-)